MTSAGELYAWGLNSSSQLGDGGGATQTIPKLISSIGGVSAVSAGTTHSLARLHDGAVYAWGANGSGQLGLGDTTTRNRPTRLAGLTALDVIAGGSHSMAVRDDGVLVAWGANGSGQVGDTTTTTPRTLAVTVSGPAQVARLAAGATHSAAVTPGGHVWTWGSDGSGQLGDGFLISNRPTPLDVLSLPGVWQAAPSPTLSVAPGTYDIAQTVVVSNSLGESADMHYTTSGAAPTLTDPTITDGASILIDGTVTLRVRAWAAGLAPSTVVTASYTLQPAVPSIAPGTGTYTTAQSVTITSAANNTVVRYTTDGTDPTSTSSVYSVPLIISTFTVLKARAFAVAGWTPSATSTTVFTFNYGILPTPTISPVGGHYHSGQAVTISADTGGQVRYTLDGSDPNDTSTLYTSPVVLPSGAVTLKARAFRVDWTMSPSTSQSYTISDDFTPPTITATLSPAPNAAGWYAGNVTVTFVCSDADSVVIWCTHPVTVTSEGADIPVIGSATDAAGNQASVTVIVSIDRTVPVVSIFVPLTASDGPAGLSEITVKGSVLDASGIASVSCNGIAATVTESLFTCTVGVTAGTNVITVSAYDLAGHLGARDITFLVGNGPPPTSIEISPSTMTMFAGDSRKVVVKDDRGRTALGGAWIVSDPSVVDVSETDGITTVNAVGPGEATLTVTYRTLVAHATLIVFAAWTEIPSGTTLWSLTDTSGVGIPPLAEVLRAASLDPSDDPENTPALFFVDKGTAPWETAIVHAPRIRATTADGRLLFDLTLDRPPQQVAADNNGGLVVVLPQDYDPSTGVYTPNTIRRIDGRTGNTSWQFASIGAFLGHVSDVAIHPDGRVFATEGQVTHNSLVGITPSGLVSRWSLPVGTFSQIDTGPCGLTNVAQPQPGGVTAPIIEDDGSVIVVSKVRVSTRYVHSWIGQDGLCHFDTSPQDFSYTATAYVNELEPGGTLNSHVLDEPDAARSFNLQTIPSANYMLPDGHGGLLLASRTHALVTRISRVPFYQVAANSGDPLPDTDTALGGFGQHSTKAEYVLAEDGLYATVSRTEVLHTTCVPPPGTDTCIAPYAAVFHTHAVQFDPETLTEISKVELGVAQAEPQWVRMKFALAGGGIFADGPTSAYAVNASVDASGFAAGGNASQVFDGFWSGWASSSPALVIGGNAPRAQTLWPSSFGNDQGSNASINPNFGIFAKGHSVALIGHHASIRIVPRNGLYWHSQFPQIFERADAFGNYFTTIGAGPPPPHDSTASCDSYPLVSGTNRDTDVTNAPTSLERLNYRSADEDRIILNLLQRDINYRDDLIYCWNPDGTMTYNSNSYAAGLLKATSIPLPTFPSLPFSLYVGWTKPVPKTQFDPH